jgi:FtsZ-interacting cell division protein ZipA
MKRKLLLIVIGIAVVIAVVIAVSYRSKSENTDSINMENSNNDMEVEDITTSVEKQSDTEGSSNKDLFDEADNEDIQDSIPSSETEEIRNNTYKDVDIEVPSIHED